MKLTDFLGKEYGPGDLVLYAAMSGRCPNMILGRVTDIYRVFHDPITYRWMRLRDGEDAPRKLNYKGEDIGECDNALRVKIQPLRGARWEQHSTRSYYVDTRSGKRINPDAPSGKHVLKESHVVHADGTEYPYDEAKRIFDEREQGYRQFGRHRGYTFEEEFRRQTHVNYGEVGKPPTYPLGDREAARLQLWWVSRTYQPWVEKREEDGPKPVTLEITGNIVKWEGELPGEVPVQVP